MALKLGWRLVNSAIFGPSLIRCRMGDFHVSCKSVVRGYHIYKDIWKPALHEELAAQQEPGNREDRYAVALLKGDDQEDLQTHGCQGKREVQQALILGKITWGTWWDWGR